MIVGTAHSLDAVNLWWTLWFLRAIWTSYQMRKIAGCVCAGNAGNVFPRRWFKRKLLVSDHGMHHGTCVTHVPWCMSESLTCGDGKTFPAFPAHAHPRIWQEAHMQNSNETDNHTCPIVISEHFYILHFSHQGCTLLTKRLFSRIENLMIWTWNQIGQD